MSNIQKLQFSNSSQEDIVFFTHKILINPLFPSLASLPNNDITNIENLQRRATKFILTNYSLDYTQRLLKLNMLPLMYQLDFYDICFFVNSFKNLL